MTEKKEILFLSHRIPYPPDKGDKIRSWRLLKHLSRRFDVHLACFIDDPRDFAHTGFLKEQCASAAFVELKPGLARLKSAPALLSKEALTFSYYQSEKMKREVAAIRRRDLVAEIAFSSSMAPYITDPIDDRLRIVDFCDADSEKWRQFAGDAKPPLNWIYAREGDALMQAETQIANWADASFAVTNQEAALFNRRPDLRRHVQCWSNGVDTAHFDPAIRTKEADISSDVVFVGAMDYRANIEAVLEFVRDCWPRIRSAAPDATFAVVGARPAPKIRALNGVDGVRVSGRVDDVRPWIDQSKIVVAPMRVARGIQNKVLEAMSMAKPVVATPAVLSCIECDEQSVCGAANSTDMAAVIIGLLNQPDRRRHIGEAARRAVSQNYDWTTGLAQFDAVLNGLGV